MTFPPVPGSYLVILPIVSKSIGDRCINSILHADSAAGFGPDNLLVVDNTREGGWYWPGGRTYRDTGGHNLGVARSWNVGAREVLERRLDYLVILSASVEFGPMVHCTWMSQMTTHWGRLLIEATGHSWHLIAIHRTVFETIGLFDENFYPAYIEADDFTTRMRLAGLNMDWPRDWVNAISHGAGSHLEFVQCPWRPLADYYFRKWGGPKGGEVYTLPFDGQPLDFWEDRPVPEIAAAYGLGSRGEGWW